MEEQGTGHAHDLTSLRDYLQVAKRRKWLILQAVLIVPIVAAVLTARQETYYRASADVLLSTQTLTASLLGTQDPAALQSPDRVAETQARIARVPDVARRVLHRAGVRTLTPVELLAIAEVTPLDNADLLVFVINHELPGIAMRLANAYASIYTEYRLELDTASLTRARNEVKQHIAELDERGERDSTLYDTLLDKEQELRTLEALQTSNASVVRRATHVRAVVPPVKRNALLGLMLGLVLGTSLAFLREALDTRVRSTDEIERRLGLPLLGRLPEPNRVLQRSQRLVMLAEPRSSEAEAFRILRANIDFLNLDLGARTIMVTSAVAQEGKSTTIANLAVALARAGHDVALVDLDLRRPILHRFFRLRGRTGVTDVVAGAELALADIGSDDAERQSGESFGSLKVLSAGTTVSAHAGDFIASTELARLLERLRESADIVLVDAPPLLLVGDAMQLSSNVDAMLVVTRLNVVRRHMLGELRRVLAACPAAKFGFVVTGADDEDEYGYGYGYGYYTSTPSRPAKAQPTRWSD